MKKQIFKPAVEEIKEKSPLFYPSGYVKPEEVREEESLNEPDFYADDLSHYLWYKAKDDSKRGIVPFGFFNPNTAIKDKAVIELYGKPLVGFFTSLAYAGIELPMFTSSMVPRGVKKIVRDFDLTISDGDTTYIYIRPFTNFLVQKAETLQEEGYWSQNDVECFIDFKVVALKATIRQVGILGLKDGYGTVMDAVVVGATTPYDYLKTNLLSIQSPPGHSVKLVDGREGIQFNTIGSPFYPPIKFGFKGLTPTGVVASHQNIQTHVYIPAGSLVTMMTYGDNLERQFTYEDGSTTNDFIAPTVIRKPIIGLKDGDLIYQEPCGESLFVRISPPSVQVSYKIYIEVVVEGPCKSSYLTNMPQMTPKWCFDFQRIKYAVENTIPAVHRMGKIGKASNNPEDAVKVFQKLKVKSSAQVSLAPALTPFLNKTLVELKVNVCSLSSSPLSNRLFKDATTELPAVNYQYFPILVDQNVYTAIVAVRTGKHHNNVIYYAAQTLQGQKVKVPVYYDSTIFTSHEAFVKALSQIATLGFAELYHIPTIEGISISFFLPEEVKQLDGVSYMYALMAAFFGCPSGGFYTGSFDEKGPLKMSQELIEAKALLATKNAPLCVLGQNLDDLMTPAITASVTPEYMEGKVITTDSVKTALLYAMTPFSIRSIKATPLQSYTGDAKLYLSRMPLPYHTQYIIMSNIRKPQDAARIVKDMSFSYKQINHAATNNFSPYIIKNKRLYDATQFYTEYPSLYKTDGQWAFEIDGVRFVQPALFWSHIKKAKYQGVQATEEEINKLKNKNALINKIDKNMVESAKMSLLDLANSVPISIDKIEPNLFIKEQNLDRATALKKLATIAGTFYQSIEALRNLILINKGNINVSNNNKVLNALNTVEIPLQVSQEGLKRIQSKPYLGFVQELVENVGSNAVAILALAAGYEFKGSKPNPNAKAINILYEYLNKKKPVTIRDEEDIASVKNFETNRQKTIYVPTEKPIYSYPPYPFQKEPQQQDYYNFKPVYVDPPKIENIDTSTANLKNSIIPKEIPPQTFPVGEMPGFGIRYDDDE